MWKEAGELLKRKSLAGAGLVHAMSYDLMPSVRIGISGSNMARLFLSPIFARLVTSNEAFASRSMVSLGT